MNLKELEAPGRSHFPKIPKHESQRTRWANTMFLHSPPRQPQLRWKSIGIGGGKTTSSKNTKCEHIPFLKSLYTYITPFGVFGPARPPPLPPQGMACLGDSNAKKKDLACQNFGGTREKDSLVPTNTQKNQVRSTGMLSPRKIGSSTEKLEEVAEQMMRLLNLGTLLYILSQGPSELFCMFLS